MKNFLSSKNPLILIFIFLTGCAVSKTPVTHVWKEIRGVGVPFQEAGEGQAVLLSSLTSNGCVWLPAGTIVFGDKPWPRSPYSPIFGYRLPKTTSIWPCTAEAVDHGLIYFSHAVIPSSRIECQTNLSLRGGQDGKTVAKKP